MLDADLRKAERNDVSLAARMLVRLGRFDEAAKVRFRFRLPVAFLRLEFFRLGRAPRHSSRDLFSGVHTFPNRQGPIQLPKMLREDYYRVVRDVIREQDLVRTLGLRFLAKQFPIRRTK